MTMGSRSRSAPLNTTIAFLVAPLVPAFVFAGFGRFTPDFMSLLLGTGVFYILSVPGIVIFALPLYMLMRKFDLVRWWSASAGGLLVGQGAALLYGSPNIVWQFGALGSVSGFVFWLVWRLGHPAAQPGAPADRPTAAPPPSPGR
jgi:hypothetical protein